MNTILVTEGTGTLGRVVVALLLEVGHEVRIASRRPFRRAARASAHRLLVGSVAKISSATET